MTDPKKLLTKAKKLIKAKAFNEVVELLPSELLKQLNDPDLYGEKAKALQRLGNVDLRNETVDILLSIDENHPVGIYYRGVLFTEKNKYDEAIEHYNKAIDIDPEDSFSYYGLGNVYYNQNKYDKAIEHYNKAIDIDPEDSFPYNGLGNVYENQNKYDKAIEHYKKAIDFDPENLIPHYNLGLTYKDKNKYKEAIHRFQKTIEIDPKYSFAHYNLGLIYKSQNQYDKAIEAFQKFISLIKDDTDSFSIIAKSKITELEKSRDNSNYDSINQLVSKIKKLLEFNGDHITHYTSMTAANALMLSGSQLRISEGAFLNDTSEGKELFNFLKLDVLTDPRNEKIFLYSEKPFIGSFVPAEKLNDLTLWRMYGKEKNEEAKGCALTLDRTMLIANINNSLTADITNAKSPKAEEDYKFYRIAYINTEGDNSFVIPENTNEKDQENLNQYMKELKNEIYILNTDKTIEKEQILNVIDLLNEIAYLFKSVAYISENEIRLIVNGIGFKKKIDLEQTIPRVYLELGNIRSLTKSVTFGPKVDKAEEWAAAFNYSFKADNYDLDIHISKLPFK